MRRILYSHSQTNVFIRGAFMGSSPKPQHHQPQQQQQQQSHRQRVYRRSWNTVWRSEMLVFLTILIVNACLAGTIPATPENITVSFLTPTTVRVSWQTLIDLNAHPVEKYIVTYKPTNDRVVQDVAGNSKATILDRLTPNTQYSVAVTAIWLGKKYRSRPVVFRTLDLPPKVPPVQHDVQSANGLKVSNARPPSPTDGLLDDDLSLAGGAGVGDDVTSTATNTLPHGRHRELPTIRGVEIGIVLIVLMVWAGAIALFFNRWGKIRMLLPYQPDYKHEQLKVPGTGVCSGGVCNGQHSHQNIHPDMFVKFDSSECGALAYQPLHCSSRHFHMLQEEHSSAISERCTRSRINSAIFVSSEGRGFDSIEFLRRHGSQSVLCRKYRSAENITDNERKKNFAEKRQWRTDESAECIAENGTDTEEAAEGEGGGGSGARAGGHLSTSSTNVGLHEAALRSVAVVKALTAIGPDSSVVTCQPTSSAGVGTGPPGLPLPPGSTGTITTSNMIVGSISIEAPPAYIKDELAAAAAAAAASAAVMPTQESSLPHTGSSIKSSTGFTNATSSSHESNDTVEELIVVATEPCPTRPRSLVHQQRSLECSASPHPSPKALHLRGVKPKIVTLPMVSVSGPSPPHEKPPPSECL